MTGNVGFSRINKGGLKSDRIIQNADYFWLKDMPYEYISGEPLLTDPDTGSVGVIYWKVVGEDLGVFFRLPSNGAVRRLDDGGIGDAHSRLHSITSATDHAPAVEVDRGKIVRADKVTGQAKYDSVSFIVGVGELIPEVATLTHGDIVFAKLEKEDFDYDLNFDIE